MEKWRQYVADAFIWFSILSPVMLYGFWLGARTAKEEMEREG